MTLKKIFLNILVFSLISSSLTFSYFNFEPIVRAQETNKVLRFCIRRDIYQDTPPYLVSTFNQYQEVTQVQINQNPLLGRPFWITFSVASGTNESNICPTDYRLAPADFSLDTYQLESNIPVLGQDSSNSSSTNSTSTNSIGINTLPSGSGGHYNYDQNSGKYTYNQSTSADDMPKDTDLSHYGPYPVGTNGDYLYNSGNDKYIYKQNVNQDNTYPSSEYTQYANGNSGQYIYDPSSGKYFYQVGNLPASIDWTQYSSNPIGSTGDYFYDPNSGQYIYKNNNAGTNSNNNSNSSANNNDDIWTVNPNPVIQVNPNLAHGRFENLDPRDYKYCVLLTRNMREGMPDGMAGREVSALQNYLYNRGYMDVEPTGYYGSNTALAVERFQYRNQIEVSGLVKADLREVLKELTCIRYPVISYVDKPISPTPSGAKSQIVHLTNKTTTKETNLPPKKIKTDPDNTQTPEVVVIPTTNVNTKDDNSNRLSTVYGNMYLSEGNNLYFTFNTNLSPYICLDLDSIDCTNESSYEPVLEGIKKDLYEVVNFSSFFSFYLYSGDVWGKAGDKVKIYLKESKDASQYYVYVVNIFN